MNGHELMIRLHDINIVSGYSLRFSQVVDKKLVYDTEDFVKLNTLQKSITVQKIIDEFNVDSLAKLLLKDKKKKWKTKDIFLHISPFKYMDDEYEDMCEMYTETCKFNVDDFIAVLNKCGRMDLIEKLKE